MATDPKVSWLPNSNRTWQPRRCLKAITSLFLAAERTASSPVHSRSNTPARLATVFVAFIAIFWAVGKPYAQDALKRDTLTLVTSSGEHEFNVEVAATRDQQARGLMFRRSMGPREGMLFVYDEKQYVSMWMRNTYISLDMIFIRDDGKVHRVEALTEPLSERIIESGDKISGVLEVVGGTADKLNLKPGDVVRHSAFKRLEH